MDKTNKATPKYFMVFNDYIKVVCGYENEDNDGLSIEESGLLFQKMLHYSNGVDYDISDNRLVDFVWKGFKLQMDRSLGIYEDKIVKSSIGGKRSSLKKWHPELAKKVEAKEMTLDEAFVIVNDKGTYKKSKGTYKNDKDTQDFVSMTKTNTNTNTKTNTNTNTNTNINTKVDISDSDVVVLSEYAKAKQEYEKEQQLKSKTK